MRRIADPHDQRVRLIELTPDGAPAADRYLQTVLGCLTSVVADWPGEDHETLAACSPGSSTT